MEKLVRFGMSIENDLLEKFDQLIAVKGYSNRSEAIRDLIRENLIEQSIQNENKPAFGVLTTVYNHHKHELDEKLTDFQHHNYKSIISTTHIHLDHDNCLEVVILKDKAGYIKKIADKLLTFKGVKHGRLTLTALESKR